MNNFEVLLIDVGNVYKTTFKIELNKSVYRRWKSMNDNYLDHIRNEIITIEAKVIVREYKNNLDKLTRNYNIGKELTLSGKHYGEGIVKK